MTLPTVETFPPAKLNLYLELIAKRPDGYHDLETVMTAINRCDAMRVTKLSSSDLTLRCQWGTGILSSMRRLIEAGKLDENGYLGLTQLPPDESNLVYRALEDFRTAFSLKHGFHVELTKHIPAGAGMGGASSDAASALLCAARLCGIRFNDVRIWEIAASLGSDIPFFLGLNRDSFGSTDEPERGNWSSAVATGRGDRVEFLENTRRTHWVVVYPPQGLSTAEVYRHCVVSAEQANPRQCLAFLRDDPGCRLQKLMTTVFFNRLLGPARCLSAWVDQTLVAIQHAGLGNSNMTGSGSACFAFARSAAEARHAVKKLMSYRLGIVFHATTTQLPAPIRMVT